MLCTSTDSHASHLDSQLDWYAIYTRHQHEKTVAGILASKGFETLLPLYSAAHRWKDRTKLLSLPLFPCYVFIKGGLERRLDILTTPDRKSTRLNSSHSQISYAVFCLK